MRVVSGGRGRALQRRRQPAQRGAPVPQRAREPPEGELHVVCCQPPSAFAVHLYPLTYYTKCRLRQNNWQHLVQRVSRKNLLRNCDPTTLHVLHRTGPAYICCLLQVFLSKFQFPLWQPKFFIPCLCLMNTISIIQMKRICSFLKDWGFRINCRLCVNSIV